MKLTIITHAGEKFETEVKSFDPKETAELTNKQEMIAIGDVVLHASTVAKVVPSANIIG